MTALGRSGLETPSYIFTTVLAGFVLVCLIIEKFIEIVEHRLPHKRAGLKAAFKRMINEVMLLGFISLLLTLGEESISSICVDKNVYHKNWIPIEALDACDSCFHDMRRLSHFFNSEERCPGYQHGRSSKHSTHKENNDHESNARRTLLASSCHSDPCSKDDEVQFISARALHEVHTFIFLIAVTHVFVVVMMFLIATWRVHRLKRWNLKDAECSVLSVDENTGDIRFYGRSKQICTGRSVPPSTIASRHTRRFAEHFNDGDDVLLPEPNPEQIERKKDIEILDGFIQKCKTHYGGLQEERQDNSSSRGARPSGVIDGETPSLRPEVSLMTRCNTIITVPESLIYPADGSDIPEMDTSVSRQEWVVAFRKQFWSLINKDEFRNLTAGFFIEYKRASCSHFAKFDNLHYEEFLSSSLDDDIDTVVQIPFTGWIFVVGGYTLWTLVDWSAWPVLIILLILEVKVMIICAKLLTIVMLLTKDNKLHKLTPKAFWYDKPGLLLPLIRNTLFILTVVLASIFQISWQYGIRSCPLAGRVADDHWIHEAATPLILIVTTFCFLHISFILMPLYSVTVHTSSLRFNQDLPYELAKQAFDRLLQEMRNQAWDGNPSATTG